MQEHPVPQNVTSYEFHLIGNMTLKQFFELATFGAFAFFAYSSNLLDILKWPLVLLFVILGIAFAFVPFEDRPLDHWLLAFVRAIYNPTKFYWKKNARIPEVFAYTQQSQSQQVDYATPIREKRSRAKAFLQSITPTQLGDEHDELADRATAILAQYNDVPAAQTVRAEGKKIEIPEKPSLQVEMHELHPMQNVVIEPESAPAKTTDSASSIFAQPSYSGPVVAPQLDAISLPKEQVVFKQPTLSASPDMTQSTDRVIAQPEMKKMSADTVTAQTNTNLPFPKTPTIPNLLVGMVLDPEGKMIEQSIVEIRDNTGLPVRALKSNKLGQFFVSTPLPNGEYELVIEKDGHSFDTMKIALTGAVVPPIEVRSKAVS
jgi:hypothetical protein